MIPRTGYVLGNGPTLPVRQLHRLRNSFAVGVNRVLLSGFEPTAIFFADLAIVEDQGEAFKRCSSLVLGAQEHRLAFAWEGVLWVPTDRQQWGTIPEPNKRVFKVRGNSAAAVALWMLALGVEHVYMLGCGCSTVAGRSHFYGAHPDPLAETRYQCAKDSPMSLRVHIDALLQHYPNSVHVVDELPQDVLDEVQDQDALRGYLRGVIAGLL